MADITSENLKHYLYALVDRVDFFDKVTALPNCNNCAKKNACEYAPQVGQALRFNCPLWSNRVERVQDD